MNKILDHLKCKKSNFPSKQNGIQKNLVSTLERTSLKINILYFFFICLSSILVSSCDYLESRSFYSAYEQNNCSMARKQLLNSLKINIKKFPPKFNLIHTYICDGELESAIKQINALLSDKSDFEFELYFIKAFLLGEMGEIEMALQTYQKALDVRADVRIKQNMELLLKGSGAGSKGQKKKGKGKKNDKSQSDDNSEGEDSDPERKNESSSKENQSKKDPKNEGSKKMTQKQIQKIMKEIDGDEKKVRSQGLKIKSKKGNDSSGKEW